MSRSRRTAARGAFGALVFAALSFGTGQAFAGSGFAVGPGEPCVGGGAFLSCWQSCTEIYGEGTQATCSSFDYWSGYYYGSTPYCQCIP